MVTTAAVISKREIEREEGAGERVKKTEWKKGARDRWRRRRRGRRKNERGSV